MKKINALHLFDSYLPTTENWVYSNLIHLPETNIHVAANQIYSNKYKNDDFNYLANPAAGNGRVIRKLKEIIDKGFPSKIITFARQNNIDLVHAHFGNIAWQYRKVARMLDAPFLISFYGHDYENVPHLYPAFIKRYEKLFELADGFICEGNNGAQLLLHKGCPEHKIHVNHLGINVETIPFYQREKKKNTLRLLQIATLMPKKGHLTTLKAFRKALITCPGLSLTLVGRPKDAAHVAAINQYIVQHNLGQQVQLIQEMEYSKLHEFMQNFDVFIHPSHYAKDMDCEGGAPIVLLDAQATGMPVLSTFHCDIPDEVLHEKTGWLVKEKDDDDLAHAIVKFYTMDSKHYKTFSLRARDHVVRNYNIRHTAVGLRKLYDQYLA